MNETPADPADNDDPDVGDVIAELIRAGIARVRTIGPGKIETYDHATQRARVVATVYGRRWDEETRALVVTESRPVVDVPVLFFAGDTWALTGPIAEGDEVVLLAAERSIDEWKATGKAGAPAHLRRHDASDWFAIPARSSSVEVLSSDAVHGTDVVLWSSNGIRLCSSAAVHFVARADRVASRIAAIETYITGLTLPVSGATAGPPAVPPWPPGTTCAEADVASDKVRTL